MSNCDTCGTDYQEDETKFIIEDGAGTGVDVCSGCHQTHPNNIAKREAHVARIQAIMDNISDK